MFADSSCIHETGWSNVLVLPIGSKTIVFFLIFSWSPVGCSECGRRALVLTKSILCFEGLDQILTYVSSAFCLSLTALIWFVYTGCNVCNISTQFSSNWFSHCYYRRGSNSACPLVKWHLHSNQETMYWSSPFGHTPSVGMMDHCVLLLHTKFAG